jgi:arginyl-tRNA synthetase
MSELHSLARAKEEIAQQLGEMLPADVSVSASDLEEPPQSDLGDLAFPCFGLAKSMRKAPPMIAADLAGKFVKSGVLESAHSVGPYVNFRLNRDVFAQSVLLDYASGATTNFSLPDPKQLIIEYGQPNTHKEVHVGHLRNFFIGLSVVRLLEAVGHKVIPVSYIGDVGAHVAKCLWAYKRFHDGERPEPGKEGKFLGGIYTEASLKVEEDESLKDEISAVQRAIESGDPEWTALWKETRQWSLDEMEAIFTELGCQFDRIYTESEVEGPGKDLVNKMLSDGIAVESQGAIVMDFSDEGLGYFLLLKSDGNSLYSTKELALARQKFIDYPDTDISIHIVDTRQSLYFQQFFATLKRLGFVKDLVHLAYDFVTLKDGAMSSRKGNVITYAEFRDQMKELATKETRIRHAEWSDRQVKETAWKITEAAMKFSMLKQDNDKPITYDPKEALAFDGFTGPYVQYAHARMCSILAKSRTGSVKESDLTSHGQKLLTDYITGQQEASFAEDEFAVLRKVAKLPETLISSARDFRPSLMAQYAFELAQEASGFYRDVPVLSAETENDRIRRLAIVAVVKNALEKTLYLLGIGAPEEM